MVVIASAPPLTKTWQSWNASLSIAAGDVGSRRNSPRSVLRTVASTLGQLLA
jgi:hypothetical protein